MKLASPGDALTWRQFKDWAVMEEDDSSTFEDRLQAFQEFRDNPANQPSPEKIADVRNRARALQRARIAEQQEKAARRAADVRIPFLIAVGLPMPPKDVTVPQSKLVEEITPDVREFRTEVWGSPEPPFPNSKAVGEWLKGLRDAYARQRKEGEEEARSEEIDKLRAEARPILKRLSELMAWGRHAYIDYVSPEVLCFTGGSAPVSFETCLSPILPKLESKVRQYAAITGFPPAWLSHFVLTGIPPEYPPMMVTAVQRGSTEVLTILRDSWYKALKVEIFSRDISDETLLKIGDYAREALMVSTLPANLTKAQLVLLQAHREVFAAWKHPKTKTLKFWDAVGQAMMDRGHRKLKPHSVRQAWRRLKEALGPEVEFSRS